MTSISVRIVASLGSPWRLLVLGLALAAGACGRSTPPRPPTAVPTPTGDADAVRLRHAAAAAEPLHQALELHLTDTRVGRYLEIELRADVRVELAAEGDGLRMGWTLRDVGALELVGTVKPDELERTRALLVEHGRGVVVSDGLGAPDLAATDAAAINVARHDALGPKAPPSAALLMTVLAEQLRPVRLPTEALRVGEAVELEEESETVIADADLVLPTTTVHRFTLRRIDESGASRVAEVAIEIASVAEPVEGSEIDARLEARTGGTLLFDVDHGIPVSLELTRTESFRVGESEGERTLLLRSRYGEP